MYSLAYKTLYGRENVQGRYPLEMSSQTRLTRPGFGTPLELLAPWDRKRERECYPHAIADFFATPGVTLREQRMLDFINQITDKPRWWEKVHDEAILARWREEACGNDEQQETSDRHLNATCFDYVRDRKLEGVRRF